MGYLYEACDQTRCCTLRRAKNTPTHSFFQAYCTSTSCLLRDLEFFIFAAMKTFVTDISASTGRNDFPVYRVTEFFMFLQHFLTKAAPN
jgi:hypothetical protein